MKISLNWLKDYLNTGDLSPEQIGEILTDIGLEVEGMEETESIKGGLEGIVVGHVVECDKHPNADKLSLTKVNIGNEELLQIVCGAPNVAQGQKVMIATIGTTLYPADAEPWKIKKGKIRGEESQGMICAEDELGIGNDHSGIIVLPEDTAIGSLGKDYYKVEKDFIYDIGLTPNRSDATSHLGVAKDLAAALKINHKVGDGLVKIPDVSSFASANENTIIDVVVEDEKACPRFSGLSLSDTNIGQAPDWMKKKLQSIGVKSINVIVDITNFILHELGQPLHAYDQDKIEGNKIIVKKLPKDTVFIALDEKEIKLRAEDLMICDGESKGMCIAGIYGGLNSGVTEKTKNIYLESAHFEPVGIRQTSTKHILRTDAAKVFEKGSDPNNTLFALKRAALLMQEYAGAKINSSLTDFYPNFIAPKEIEVKYEHINRMMGISIDKGELMDILAALNMPVKNDNGESFVVAVPTDKFDVIREADVIEEVIRIYGLNKIPIPTKIHTSISTSKALMPLKVKEELSSILVASGFNEMMAVSLSRSSYYENILPRDKSELIFVNNTSNRDFDVMRPDMIFSALEAVAYNQNRQNQDLRLFEYGKTYVRNNGEMQEEQLFSLCMTGSKMSESWLNKGKNEVSFYTLKSYIKKLLDYLGIKAYQEEQLSNESFVYGLKFFRGPLKIAEFGKLKTSISKKMDIKNEVFFGNLYMNDIFRTIQKQKVKFAAINKYPGTRRDLALVIDDKVNFSQIEALAKKTEKKFLKGINLFDVYSNEDQLGKGKKSYAVSFNFENPERTMKDKEVEKIMNSLIDKYEKELNAVIRR